MREPSARELLFVIIILIIIILLTEWTVCEFSHNINCILMRPFDLQMFTQRPK